jgi:hypothetical protein
VPERGRHSAGPKRRGAQAPAEAPRGRRSAGPRRSALQRRRKTLRKRSLAGGGLALVVGLVIALVVAIVGTGAVVKEAVDDDIKETAAQPVKDDLVTYLVLGTASRTAGEVVRWLTVLGVDEAAGSASVAYLPASTASEVPGRGLQAIGDALASGGISLVKVSAENLLGFRIDHFLELPVAGAEALFEETGNLAVNVPAQVRVPAGEDTAQVLFEPGEQVLSPSLQADLLYEVGVDGDQGELGQRHLSFWQSFLEARSEDPEALGTAVGTVSEGLADSDASTEEKSEFFSSLASTSADEVTIASLPVNQEVVGDTELYSTDDAEVRTFVEDTFGPLPPVEDEVRVQILNGNGSPGIGEQVATKLVGEGFRVVLSGNADRLDYADTRIVIYESTPEAQESAGRVRDLLGVGEVQVSLQPQGIVDLTIVVGEDFIDATDSESD